MKRKLSLIIMMVFLLNIVPSTTITKIFKLVKEVNALTVVNNLTREDIIKNNSLIDLSGAINNIGINLKEVSGSNDTKFSSTFIVPSTTSIGDVNITIKNLTNNNGVFYDSYIEKNVFSKIASVEQVAPVTEIRLSQESYRIGDYLNVNVSFDRPINSSSVLMDISGAIEANDIRPGKGGPDSAGFAFYINEESANGPINITIKNVKGLDDGMVYGEYTKENVCYIYSREDINKDCVIDALDLALVGLSYNTTIDDNNWNSNADVNNDYIVDIFDLVLVSKKM